MRLDKYSNPVFDENDLIEALYKGQTISNDLCVEPTKDIASLSIVSGIPFTQTGLDNLGWDIEKYDRDMQSNWFMPLQYRDLDIIQHVMFNCPQENLERAAEELEAFEKRNMLDLLRWLKYFVDTCTKEGILWGLGRGSSVASYVLYLLGVHNIDSVKYNLDWREFLR